MTSHLLPLLSLAAAAGAARADVFWNEAVNGDLSNNGLAPTAVNLGPGTHSLMATTGGGDLDYLAITIPPGTQLAQLILVSYQGTDITAFIGMQTGGQITEPAPFPNNVGNLLGWSHFGPGPGNVGTDILDNIGMGSGAQGFVPPLPAGTYAFWLQQLGGAVSYQFDFVITGGATCYANCDGSTTPPILNVNDFACFGAKFAAGDSYANCDGSTAFPVLSVNDFICFQARFAAGCP